MKFIKVENLESDWKVKVVTLARPEVKNAFHPEMIAEITEFFRKENEAMAIILRGEGSAFCAGADLNWMKSMVSYSYEQNVEDSLKLWDMFAAMKACACPVVAVAHGAVFGGALGLLACADYVFAEEKTRFCFSEVKLGLAPAVISGFIAGKLPDAFYRPFMISAEVFGAEQARAGGLVHQVYQGSITGAEVFKKFSGNGPVAMKETKKLLNFLSGNPSADERRLACARVIAERRTGAEGQERLQQFLNKASK